jgi:hypothetical protein
MSRLSYAFRSFFAILFSDALPSDIAQAYGFTKAAPVKATSAPPPPKPAAPSTTADGAAQMLGLLQREARLLDFLMEDIGPYSDEQVGAVARDVQVQARQTLDRYVKPVPVIDAVEETTIETKGLEAASYKLIGNVPASGKAPSGLLRHKGWKAESIDLPKSKPTTILAPAELEVE